MYEYRVPGLESRDSCCYQSQQESDRRGRRTSIKGRCHLQDHLRTFNYCSQDSSGSTSTYGDQHSEWRLTPSANLCRWILDANDIIIAPEVCISTAMSTSASAVMPGRWKGIEVAVKRFAQHSSAPLAEQLLLDFHEEMGRLAHLRHPNVVLFIGTPSRSKECARVLSHQLASSSFRWMRKKALSVRGDGARRARQLTRCAGGQEIEATVGTAH